MKQLTGYPEHLLKLDSPWFALGTVLIAGLGYSALSFLLYLLYPRQSPETFKEKLLILLTLCVYLLVIPVAFNLMLWLPHSPAEIKNWHWIVIVCVPFLLWLSYAASPWVIRKQNFSVSSPATHPKFSQPTYKSAPGTSGLRMLLGAMHGRILLIILSMSLAIWLPQLWWAESRPRGADGWSRVQINVYQQISAYMMMFTAFLPDWFSLRMLRGLPLSTRSLTLSLLSVPMILGVFLVIQLAWQVPAGMWPECGARGLFTAGAGAAMLTFACHVSSRWRYLMMIVPPLILMFDLLKNPALIPWLALIGTVLLLASGLLMHRGFWRSPGYYRPRRAFGMNADSPAGQS